MREYNSIYYDFLLCPLLGNIYIADTYNNRVRKVTVSTTTITTIAGNGDYTDSGDGGVATSAGIYSPYGVTVDPSGRYIILLLCVHMLPDVTL